MELEVNNKEKNSKEGQQIYEKKNNEEAQIIKEMQTKSAMIYHFISIRKDIIKEKKNNKCW